MRQHIWDVATGNTTIDWPEHIALPGKACEELGYHQEAVIGTGGISLVIYQWPQQVTAEMGRATNERRYLLVLTMVAGYEIIGARDLKGLLLALKTLEPIIHVIETPAGDVPRG